MKVLFNSFRFNGHALGFHRQTLVGTNHLVQHNKQYHLKVLLNSFHLNGHTRVSSTDVRVRTTLNSIINSTI